MSKITNQGNTNMKVRLFAALAIAMLPLMGFDCINDPVYLALNVTPITATFPIDSKSIDKTYGPVTTTGLYNNGYKLQDVSVYDLRVSTSGTPTLGTTSFTVQVRTIANGSWQNVVTCSGPWADFNTPQSIFNTKYFSTPDGAALNALIASAFVRNRLEIRVTGSIANVPSSATTHTATVSLYMQARGAVSTSK
jgi:hypothetical protein